MAFSLPDAERAKILTRVSLLVGLIALADWRVQANVPLGFLYLLPTALAGASFRRPSIIALAALCAALAELFDGFTWTLATGIPRDLLYLCAFCGCGLFVHETLDKRRRSALHLTDLEKEIRARQDAEEQLEVLIESSPIAIVTADADGRVLLSNDAAHRLLLVAPGQLQNQRIDTYLPALSNVPALRNGQPSFRTVMQCPGQRQDGEVFLAEVWFSTYFTSRGPRLAAMVVDTSQDLRDREEANLQHLLAGSRILVGAVSHEVRNVCGAIAVVHQNLARSGVLRNNQDFEALGTLVLALERIASLDLREAAEQPARVRLHAFFEELRVMVDPALREKGIVGRWSIPNDLPDVWADRQSLVQVFLNLIRNSESALALQASPHLAITACAGAEHVSATVSDNGAGVEHPELLFRPFQQRSKHVGLGLYLSRALLRSFKGDLSHQPTPQGATFVVELARVHEAPDDPE